MPPNLPIVAASLTRPLERMRVPLATLASSAANGSAAVEDQTLTPLAVTGW
jgi:hypothetical protein